MSVVRFTRVLAVFMLGFSSILLQAQSPSISFESVYEGGEAAFSKFLRKNLKYPIGSTRLETQGTLIYAIDLHPEKGVKVRFLTLLDKDIEGMVAKSIEKSSRYWKAVSSEVTFYQAIYFNLGKPFSGKFKESVKSFKQDFAEPWLKPVSVTAYASNVRQVVSSTSSRSTAGSTGSSSGTSSKPAPVLDQLKAYNSALKRFAKLSEKKKYKKAYQELNLAIGYNPFEVSLLEERMRIEKELGQNQYQAYDERMMAIMNQLK